MKGNKVEVIKPIRKMRLRAKLLNLSLQEKENTVTFSVIQEYTSGVPIPVTSLNRWAYYQPFLMGILEKAFDYEQEIILTIHRNVRFVGGKPVDTKDIIVKAEFEDTD